MLFVIHYLPNDVKYLPAGSWILHCVHAISNGTSGSVSYTAFRSSPSGVVMPIITSLVFRNFTSKVSDLWYAVSYVYNQEQSLLCRQNKDPTTTVQLRNDGKICVNDIEYSFHMRLS